MSVKILRIIARLNIGGPARNAILLTKGLKAENFETLLACGQVAGHEGDMGYLAKEKSIPLFIIKELGRELSFRSDWRAFLAIYDLIYKERPDIIHTHTAKAGTLGRLAGILYNIRFIRRKKIIMVHTFHGHAFHSYFGKVKNLFFMYIERILGIFTDQIITVSASLKRELSDIFKIAPAGKVSVVELGFELDKLLRLQVRPEADFVNIGIVGRLTAIKNHKMFLRIADKLRGKSSKIKFVIIGDGELRKELEGYVASLGMDGIIEFKGWVKDLGKIYESLDIVALTSFNEGTPVSIIEAMASSRAVIATNVGGVPDILINGDNGYLVRVNAEDDFTAKLWELINDRRKRIMFGERARLSVKTRFSKERLIIDTEEVYNAILKRKR